MKNKNTWVCPKLWTFFPFLFLIISCNDDITEVESFQSSDPIEANIVVDGRLYFKTQEDLKAFYDELKDEDTQQVSQKLDILYTNDFYSLLPILTDKNEDEQGERHFSKLNENHFDGALSRSASLNENQMADHYSDLEDIFGEETFASLLNHKGEIEVNNKIYKYTDVGLFIVSKDQIHKLNEYLIKEQVSKDFVYSTSEAIRNKFISLFDSCDDQPIDISDKDTGITSLQYYVHPSFRCGVGIANETSISNENKTEINSANRTSPDAIRVIADGLKECSGNKPWLANLFGTTRVCEDQYDKRQKLKIKYYTNNYVLGYAIGVKVKHQKKGWTGIWREQNAEEIAVGINSVSWAWNKISVYPTNQNFPAIWYFNGDSRVYRSQLGALNASYVGEGGPPLLELPFIRNADVVVEIVTNDYGFLNTEEKVRKFFYQNVYNSAKALLSSYRNKELKSAVAIINTNTATWVQYYDFTFQCTNCDEYNKTFDWGAVTPKISYTFGTSNGFGGGSFKGSLESFDFKNPKVTGMNMFGMSKNGGKWHGKRLIF